MLDTDETFGFDYVKAQNANRVVTEEVTDGFQGVWYGDQTDPATGKFIKKYLKLVVDGYGHATMYYLFGDGSYHFNWDGWGSYVEGVSGITVSFNHVHTANFTPYYENNLMYTKSSWLYGEMGFYKLGYQGDKIPPVFSSNWAGRYSDKNDTENTIIFNIRTDLTGSYKGAPLTSVVFDGASMVYFTAANKEYSVNFATAILSFDNEQISLDRMGAVVEILPSDLVGTWTGVWEGYGVSENKRHSIRIDNNANAWYISQPNSGNDGVQLTSVKFDRETNILTGKMTDNGSTIEVKLTYDVKTGVFRLFMSNEENREWTATLNKD
jgi:hypothetical protein